MNKPKIDLAQPVTSSSQHATPVYPLGLLLSLYVAQGLPAGFITQALPAILRQHNVSLTMIGFVGFLLLPWALKFLWAPVVDRHYRASVGQSRSWIVPTQIGAALLVASIAWIDPARLSDPAVLLPFFAMLFVLNLLGATQDVATDGLAVRMLGTHLRQWGNAVQVTGYRLGLIIGGGGLLLVLGTWGWMPVFLAMAGLIALNTLPILWFREPVWPHTLPQSQPSEAKAKATWWRRFQVQFGYFWHSAEMRAWLTVLLVFKIADGLSSSMVKPMMVDMGYRLEQIGLLASIIGSASSLIGAGIGALLIRRLGRFTALISFNALQALCTGLYALAAWRFEVTGFANTWLVFGVNAIEHTAGAMALVALLTLAMDYARPQRAGSDFTFQVCMVTLIGGTGHLVSGVLADQLGYGWHFVLSACVGIVLLWPLLRWGRIYQSNALLIRPYMSLQRRSNQ
ncbi:MAG: MFS transporter [Pseudomonadota bacterium]|nr:MFS transporter [Pseudomonadota bacterium]